MAPRHGQPPAGILAANISRTPPELSVSTSAATGRSPFDEDLVPQAEHRQTSTPCGSDRRRRDGGRPAVPGRNRGRQASAGEPARMPAAQSYISSRSQTRIGVGEAELGRAADGPAERCRAAPPAAPPWSGACRSAASARSAVPPRRRTRPGRGTAPAPPASAPSTSGRPCAGCRPGSQVLQVDVLHALHVVERRRSRRTAAR